MRENKKLAPKRRPKLSTGLRLSTVFVFFLTFVVFGPIASDITETIVISLLPEASDLIIDAFTGASAGLSGTVGALLFTNLWKLGKRVNAKQANEVLQEDKRPYILFLRSFQEDSKNLYEVTLTKLFKEIGPLVALGQPKEKLPPLGASRMYFDHSSWQSAVIEALKKASIVVIQASTTESLLWEISQAKRLVKPERILICFSTPTQYRDCKSKISETIASQLPTCSEQDIMFLYFSPVGRPVVAQRPKRWYHSREQRNSKLVLKTALGPFLNALGIKVNMMEVYLKGAMRLGCLVPFIAVSIIFMGTIVLITVFS